MNERFEEINKIISSHVDNNITRANVSCVANIKDGGRQLNQFIVVNKIINILEQEIELAKEEGKKEGREEERKRIVEMIEEELELSCVDDRLLGKTDEYLSGYYKSTERWREKRDDLVTLITNNK